MRATVDVAAADVSQAAIDIRRAAGVVTSRQHAIADIALPPLGIADSPAHGATCLNPITHTQGFASQSPPVLVHSWWNRSLA